MEESDSVPFEEASSLSWLESTSEVKKFCGILDEVIDDASYGWNQHLEDQVQWCVWSAPVSIHIAFRLNLLAAWLMYWDMYKEAELALRKALICGVKEIGFKDQDCIRTLVSLSRAVWKQKRLEEALVLLQSAGEAFSAVDNESCQCEATRCFVKVAAAYDTLGWHRLAQDVWDRVSDLL